MITSLNFSDLTAISPLLILIAGILLLIFLEAFFDRMATKLSFWIALGVIAAAICAALQAPTSDNTLLTNWLSFDGQAHFFTLLFLVIGFSCVLLSAPFFQQFPTTQSEYYFLLLSSLFGLILIGAAADFLTLFLGMETLSIALYILCCYQKSWNISQEGAMKYFFIGALAAAILLYGVAFIYGAIGTTSFNDMLAHYEKATSADRAMFLFGTALVTVGIAFKAAIFPFHAWAPDVYYGAPTPVTAFMAVATKAGAFAGGARIFIDAIPHFDSFWSNTTACFAAATLLYANFVAMRQTQLRRFFAYSGISHAAFMLIPLIVATEEALHALQLYLVVYAVATLGAFAVLAFLDRKIEGVQLADLHGLFNRAPWLAGVMALCLLVLGGIPPTVGFFAKFYILKIAFQSHYYLLVIVALLTSILSAFYYTRIVAHMFAKEPPQEPSPLLSRAWPAATVAAASLVAIVWLSLFPNTLRI